MHPQDRLLLAEALVAYAGTGEADETPRQRRAWDLAADLLAVEGLGFDALTAQVDAKWSGP